MHFPQATSCLGIVIVHRVDTHGLKMARDVKTDRQCAVLISLFPNCLCLQKLHRR